MSKILKVIPFSYHWIVRSIIRDDIKTVLDLGCGEGDFMEDISENKSWDIVGVELFSKAIKVAKARGIYKNVFKADVTKLPPKFKRNKYDLVFSSQVLEHLNKKIGKKSLTEWSLQAKKQIIVTTTNGFIDYEPIYYKKEENTLQKHRSGWVKRDFENLGFIVYGQGLKIIYGNEGLSKRFPSLLPFFYVISYVFAPIVFYKTSWATYLIAVKEK